MEELLTAEKISKAAVGGDETAPEVPRKIKKMKDLNFGPTFSFCFVLSKCIMPVALPSHMPSIISY